MGDRIRTPDMLRDRADVHRQKMVALRIDQQWTDSSHARDLIQRDIDAHDRRAAALEAEAQTLERDLARAQPAPRPIASW